MRKRVLVVLTVGLVYLAIVPSAFVATTGDIDRVALSKLEFQAPDNPADRSYLGITNKPLFSLSDLKGKVILMELFSMYCPICQAEAPVINTVFKFLNEKPELASAVIMLGIGTGNTPFEVDVYRKKYQVPFPLVPDDKMTFRKAYPEEIRTPTFLLAKIDEQGNVNVLFRHVGQMKDPQLYVEAVVKALSGK